MDETNQFTTLEEVYNHIRIAILKGDDFDILKAIFFGIPVDIKIVQELGYGRPFTIQTGITASTTKYSIDITATPPKFIKLLQVHSYPYIIIKFIMLNNEKFKIDNDTFHYNFTLTKEEFTSDVYKEIISSVYYLCQYLHLRTELPELIQKKHYKEATKAFFDIIYFDYGLVIDKEQLAEFGAFITSNQKVETVDQ